MFAIQLKIPLVCNRQPHLNDPVCLIRMIRNSLLNLRICLARDERQRHEGHYRQADKFIEVSYKYGFHRCNSKGPASFGELVL